MPVMSMPTGANGKVGSRRQGVSGLALELPVYSLSKSRWIPSAQGSRMRASKFK